MEISWKNMKDRDIKIAFFDVDGTMVDMVSKKITPRMKETLIKLKEKGVKICMATGRPLSCIPKFDGIDFDVLLTFNGSYCCHKDNVIYKNPISKNDVQKVIDNATSINRPVSIASTTRLGANGKDRDLEIYFAFAKQKLEVVDDFDVLAKGDIYQIMLACTKDEHSKIIANADGVAITSWWDRAVDIIPSNGNKGVSVEKTLEYFKLDKENAIAFGDGANDIEMLQAVGIGVAMGNAAENVKASADEVCGKVSEDGIYHYCLNKGLI